ncbi:hypothetical protein ACSVBT_17375 [Afipia sp. TerB]
MPGSPDRIFKPDQKYPSPEAAARELLRVYREHASDGSTDAYTGVTNMAFLRDGGSIAEYRASVLYGQKANWVRIDDSGSSVTVLATTDATPSRRGVARCPVLISRETRFR